MELEYTPLFREARAIMDNGATTANITWTARIHYGEDKYCVPLIVKAINVHRDYRKSFADIRTITVTMGYGDYARLIYPNRVGLEVTLTKQDLVENSGTTDTDGRTQSEKYSASLLDGPTAPTTGQGAESNDREALNLTQLIDVHFQLFDKAAERIRVMLCGGIYRTVTMEAVLKTVLTKQALSAEVDQSVALTGIDMVSANNQDLKGQVVIPHGLKLIDLPDFLQKRFGVYSAGIGSYIQNNLWHIYPLYDTSEFTKRRKTLTILVVPRKKFQQIERSFRVDGDSTMIVVAGETGFKDDSGTNYVDSGNGVRFASAKNLMESPVTTSGNRAFVSRSANAAEFVADTGVNGVNNAAMSAKRITDNPFTEYSFLASKNGGVFKANWQNGDPALIEPGMCAKVVYVDGEEIKQIYGVVHAVDGGSHLLGGISAKRFSNQLTLTVFVNGQVISLDE